MSYTVVYTDEAIKECDAFFGKKLAYVGTNGKFINDHNVDTVNYVTNCMTGF